jgi:hypothetical protein
MSGEVSNNGTGVYRGSKEKPNSTLKEKGTTQLRTQPYRELRSCTALQDGDRGEPLSERERPRPMFAQKELTLKGGGRNLPTTARTESNGEIN